MQIPSGMALQVYNPEFISLSCSLLMALCSLLFAVSESIEMASITQLLSGIAQSATGISVITTIDKRLGPQMIAFAFGVVVLYCFLSLLLMQYLQALIYEMYSVWRPTFYFCGICCLMLSIISIIAVAMINGP